MSRKPNAQRAHAMMIVLTRLADYRGPYARLALAVVRTALEDLESAEDRACALYEIRSGALDGWLMLLGIRRDYLLRLADLAGIDTEMSYH